MIDMKRFLFALGLPLKLLPRRKVVLFRSFHGQYSDNPKYISKFLYDRDPNISQVWAISEEANKKDIPSYIKTVKYNSIKYYYFIFRSKIVVENYLGIVYAFCSKKSKFYNFISKDKKQLNISTWHGTPLKKIGKDQNNQKNKYLYTSSNIVTVNSVYVKKIFEKAFGKKEIELYGSPRNDILFKKCDSKIIKNKLGIPVDKKVVLFAPTFREDIYESGIRQIEEIDFQKLINCLYKKFGGEWVFVLRVHNEVLKKFDFSKFNQMNLINGNKHDDMAEYLAITDVLITDYSSSLFDFLYTKKPCFLWSLDKDNYEKKERGLYMNMEDLPYPLATKTNDLYSNILNYNQNQINERIKSFLDKLGSVEDGKSSERIANIIYNYYHYNNIRGK